MLYEINTRCWLRELSQSAGKAITLDTVPEAEFARWRRLGFSYVWLMGVWTSGPKSREQALSPPMRAAYAEVLPDWQETDVAASPYAIADYHVPAALGGETGLRAFRGQLHEYGLKLVLDFVPNHVGLDHPWVRERPELLVQSATAEAGTFAQQTNGRKIWLAHGKDPYSGAWTDTVQLDYRVQATHLAMTSLLESVAARCDGVRCDMAMLVLSDVIARTWQRFPAIGPPANSEFWSEAIRAVKRTNPRFLFLAEAYWGVEPRLQELGFDYTYDKDLYDRLAGRRWSEVGGHLLSHPPEFVAHSAHFLENHDEPRIAHFLSTAEHRAAALVLLGLPGLRFLHEGQLSGARLRSPVQLIRRPREPEQPEVRRIYEEFLALLPATAVGQGRFRLCRPRAAWEGNPTADNFVIVYWESQPPEFDLVAVNLAPHPSQCYVALPALPGAVSQWSMKNRIGPGDYLRSTDELQKRGLYLDVPPHGAQLFQFRPA